ncbi:MAG: zinc ribbon domain-containing protein [Candidatus Methanomethyliaceae archaeon]
MLEIALALAVAVIMGVIPAYIASEKGYNFFLWWLYGTALFIVAIFHAILLKPTEEKQLATGMVKCPYCAEIIRAEAKICRYCRTPLSGETLSQTEKEPRIADAFTPPEEGAAKLDQVSIEVPGTDKSGSEAAKGNLVQEKDKTDVAGEGETEQPTKRGSLHQRTTIIVVVGIIAAILIGGVGYAAYDNLTTFKVRPDLIKKLQMEQANEVLRGQRSDYKTILAVAERKFPHTLILVKVDPSPDKRKLNGFTQLTIEVVNKSNTGIKFYPNNLTVTFSSGTVGTLFYQSETIIEPGHALSASMTKDGTWLASDDQDYDPFNPLRSARVRLVSYWPKDNPKKGVTIDLGTSARP